MNKKKRKTPNYITLDGNCYEKISNNSVEVELELGVDVLAKIDSLITKGEFISRGDCIRTILREAIKDKK